MSRKRHLYASKTRNRNGTNEMYRRSLNLHFCKNAKWTKVDKSGQKNGLDMMRTREFLTDTVIKSSLILIPCPKGFIIKWDHI